MSWLFPLFPSFLIHGVVQLQAHPLDGALPQVVAIEIPVIFWQRVDMCTTWYMGYGMVWSLYMGYGMVWSFMIFQDSL